MYSSIRNVLKAYETKNGNNSGESNTRSKNERAKEYGRKCKMDVCLIAYHSFLMFSLKYIFFIKSSFMCGCMYIRPTIKIHKEKNENLLILDSVAIYKCLVKFMLILTFIKMLN